MKNTKAAKDSITTRSEKIINKLVAVSAMKPGDQWCTSSAEPQRPGFTTSINRTIKNIWHDHETRALNITDIEETVDSSFRILSDIDSVHENHDINKEDQIMYEKISSDIKSGLLNSRDGISNLKVTYHDDEINKQRLQKLIDSIKKRYTKSEIPSDQLFV